LIGEGLPVAYATGSLPPRDELPLINVQAASNDCKINVLPGHQGRVGGYPVQDPQIPRLPNLGKVCCVDEEFQSLCFFDNFFITSIILSRSSWLSIGLEGRQSPLSNKSSDTLFP
jgi:hypothetical protein